MILAGWHEMIRCTASAIYGLCVVEWKRVRLHPISAILNVGLHLNSKTSQKVFSKGRAVIYAQQSELTPDTGL